MLSRTSNLFIDEQHATVAAAATKRKEDDTSTAIATAQWEHEALVTAMATTHKTLNEPRACEHTATLAREKEKTIIHYLK
jgi:hypothetical protein